MKPAALQLVRYKLMQFSVEFCEKFDSEKTFKMGMPNNCGTALSLRRVPELDEEIGNWWDVAFRFSYSPEEGDNAPYSYSVGLLGSFLYIKALAQSIDEETLVGVNGTSMLYGIARDLILTMTSKGPHQRLLLPTMSFADYKEMLESNVEGDVEPVTDS